MASTLLSPHQLSLYNVGRMSPEQVIAAFAVRQAQLDRIVADLGAEKPKSRAQHHLIVGQRGMGKTMLLARIAAEIRTSAELSSRFIPLVFAEEQYAVDRLSKFWLNCLDSLADACVARETSSHVDEIDATVERLAAGATHAARNDQPFADEVYGAFAEAAKSIGCRPVLLVDNLQLVFDRLDDNQQHGLRELLMRPGGPILVGASPSPPPQSEDYGAAFYDHFKVHYLRPLEEAEMRSLLLHLADSAQRNDVRQRVVQHPSRLSVLRQLTGGNPRTAVTLFFLYAEDFAPTVFGDLEGLLDRVTPLYKARFEELTAQQQVIASAVANHWDPVTATDLAAATSLPGGTISAQLDRLEKTGVVERTELFGETRIGYQLAERFFNIWFLMRSASRRQRREVEFLTRFLESFYEPADRDRLARQLMAEDRFSPDRYLWSRAVAASLTEPETAEELKRHAELTALREASDEARARLREILELERLPPATLAFDDLRKKLTSLVPADANVTPEDFAQAVLGDRGMFTTGERERLAARSGKLTGTEIDRVLEAVDKARIADETTYSRESVEWLCKRLADGQIRSRYDAEDWNRAFHQAGDDQTIRLMTDSLPDGLGASINDSSVTRIQKAIQPNDSSPAFAWLEWGVLTEKLRRHEEAEAAYRAAIDRDPEDSFLWRRLGNLLMWSLHRFDEAEQVFRKAIDLDPQSSWNWSFLGDLLRDYLNRFAEAEAAYREAIRCDPKDAWPWIGLGDILREQAQKLDEAEGAYREAARCDEKNVWPWIRLGDLFREARRFDEAEAAYLEATDRNPMQSRPWESLGFLYLDNLDRFFDAAEAFDQAIALQPTYELLHHRRLFLRRDLLGEASRARPLLDALLSLPATDRPELTRLQEGLFAAYESNWGLAREALGKVLTDINDRPPVTGAVMEGSAVLLHLNYGAELLELLEQRGDATRLRPWVEALRAHKLGDRRALANVAPEIRVTAEGLYDGIERFMKKLPEKTRRRPVAPEARRGRRSAESKWSIREV